MSVTDGDVPRPLQSGVALRALTPVWRQLQSTVRAQARLLIVDDEPAVRMVLAQFFADDGLSVEQADSIEAALPILSRTHIDLALVDKNLPAASGIELVAKLRDTATQAVLITGFPSLDTVSEALDAGAADYLAKPFDMEHVQNRVRALLDRTARQAVFERILADVRDLLAGVGGTDVEQLKRRLEATRRHIDAASGILLVGDARLEPATLELALAHEGASNAAVQAATLDDVYDSIAAGASPRVVVLSLGAGDLTATVRQLKAADASLDILLLARTVEVARLLSVVHAGAADFVLPTVEGLPLLARRVRRLSERVRRHRLYLGLLAALYRFATATDPESAETVLAVAAPAERRLVRAGFGDVKPSPSDDPMDDLPTLERHFSGGRAW